MPPIWKGKNMIENISQVIIPTLLREEAKGYTTERTTKRNPKISKKYQFKALFKRKYVLNKKLCMNQKYEICDMKEDKTNMDKEI